MKKFIKILLSVIISIFICAPEIAHADEVQTNPSEDISKRLIVRGEPDTPINAFVGMPVNEVDFYGVSVRLDGKRLAGITTYPDYDSSKAGTYEFHWVFTPNDASIEPITGTVRVNFMVPEPEESDEPTPPSLTATTVLLTNDTSYDINLNNKVSGATYKWTSSNDKVAKVNIKNGLVTAVSEGTATISCAAITPDGTTYTLSSAVTVGYDDNAPLLTETSLDLETGDVFDINLENKVAKSKYRWVSSDRSITTVNNANGKVTANAPGTAYVTCTITTPDNQIIVLKCDISVTEPNEVTG